MKNLIFMFVIVFQLILAILLTWFTDLPLDWQSRCPPGTLCTLINRPPDYPRLVLDFIFWLVITASITVGIRMVGGKNAKRKS